MMRRARWLKPKRRQKVFQPVVHQHDVRLFQRRIRAARPHRHAHVRDRQAGRIVHAVADHRHPIAALAQRLDRRHFFLRLQFRAHFVEVQLGLQMLRRRAPVAGQHDRAQAAGFQLVHHALRLRTDVVAQNDAAQAVR